MGRSILRGFVLGAFALLPGPSLRAEGTPPPAVPAPARDPAEAFQKGPIGIRAEVVRTGPDHRERRLPLFQVPVLRFQDRLDISLSGEAFDPRVTRADWTLITVFLPRTVAPTERGVVELRLRRKGDEMVAAPFQAPYDAIPMFFLVPDTGGRRKILADLSAHLEAFRAICLKLSDLTERRADADRFLAGLEAIQKGQSPAAYDSTVMNFLKAYGGQLSQDFQVFLARNNASNLEKFQFLTQEFTRTNLLAPGAGGGAGVTLQGQAVSGPVRPASAYVAIAFDLVQIFQNLWPGHQFQYVPALARAFEGSRAQLWYGDWIHTTGEVRGALVFSPCRWTDADPPAFTFDLPPQGSLLRPFGRVTIQARPQSNRPFALYGHGWHLVLEGSQGHNLAPIPLEPSPDRQAFVIQPGPAQAALRALNLPRVTARIEGGWGFESLATPAVELPAGLDPAWRPDAEARAHFMLGEACTTRLPAAWSACVGSVRFQPAQGGVPLAARLVDQPDGSRAAVFPALSGTPGPGTLDLVLDGADQPTLRVPMALLPPLPVVDHVEAHEGESTVLVAGSHLREARACRFGDLLFLPGQRTGEGWTFHCNRGSLPGAAGATLDGELLLGEERTLPLKGIPVLPPRPQIGQIQVLPEHDSKGLPLTSDRRLLPPDALVMISVLSARKGAYPFGRKPGLRLRSSEEPATVHAVPAQDLRVVGRGQRILASLRPQDLFGPSGGGHLEVQVADAKAGSSAWAPLEPLFLELPAVSAVTLGPTGARLQGPALETIEAVAPSPEGPWTPFSFGFREGQEVGEGPLPAADGGLYLRLLGWPDLKVRLQGPIPVPPASIPAHLAPRPPAVPAVPAPVPPQAPVVPPPRAPEPPAPGQGTAAA